MIVFQIFFFMLSVCTFAEPEDPSPEPALAPPAGSEELPGIHSEFMSDEPVEVAPPKKGRIERQQQQAQGTKAYDRFESETVIKSQYRSNGRQLDVDPD